MTWPNGIGRDLTSYILCCAIALHLGGEILSEGADRGTGRGAGWGADMGAGRGGHNTNFWSSSDLGRQGEVMQIL